MDIMFTFCTLIMLHHISMLCYIIMCIRLYLHIIKNFMLHLLCHYVIITALSSYDSALPWRPSRCWTCVLPSPADCSWASSWLVLIGSDQPLAPPPVFGRPVRLDENIPSSIWFTNCQAHCCVLYCPAGRPRSVRSISISFVCLKETE